MQRRKLFLAFLLLFSVWLVSSGFTDLDWQLVSYRYSQWHRGVDYWEFCPFLKVNWWLAYMLSVVRLCMGCFLLGVLAVCLLKQA